MRLDSRRVTRRLRQPLADLGYVLAGSTVMALAYSLFLIPHRIVPGGVGGLAMVLNYYARLPVGATILVLNVPLLAVGTRVLGGGYGIRTLVGVAVSSAMLDGLTYLVRLGPATDSPILACIFGGVLLGAGLGLVFRGGGSTGGSDIVGQIVHRYSNLSTGTAILVVDFVIITLAGLSFARFELALYGYVNLYLQSRAIDLVLEGLSYTRAMFIISDSAGAVARAITKNMNRGATLIQATGAHTGESRNVVFTVMSKREVARAREVVREVDDGAFVIITDVYEVLGEGFRPRG